jgi:1-aminocyclopropane-1-carboxylate deaminase/D-cysteine desulfhydrase-like pyridoxal-dependent ACC family enzyme
MLGYSFRMTLVLSAVALCFSHIPAAEQRSEKVIPPLSGPAYGEADVFTDEAIRLAARLEGLALDPVYSGKGMAGLIGLARQGRFGTGGSVVWIHTGGGPGIFAYPTTMGRLAGDRAT